MVKITNGSRTTTVTRGVFDAVYAPMGWKIAESSEKTHSADTLPESESKSPENGEILAGEGHKGDDSYEDYDSEQVEIPLSEMKLAELKAYAAKHDIDISAAKTKQDIRAIIKAEMEE